MAAVARARCHELISCLPLSSVSYAFAYGSGVIAQQGENPADKMVDFIVCTRDATAFHSENLDRNPSHYSLARINGVRGLVRIQSAAARVYYNTHIRVNQSLIKYGVVSDEDLRADLLDWKWLYLAGRLQKPVLDVIEPSSSLLECVVENRRCALQAALLQLPDSFTLHQLLEEIVSLSYRGDFRMIIGEDKSKVQKIVSGSLEALDAIYRPFLLEDPRVEIQGNRIIQDASTSAVYHRLNLLPFSVVSSLQRRWNSRMRRMKDVEEVLFNLARHHDVSDQVREAVSSIVRASAFWQSAKNALTAGLARSLVYSAMKLGKWSRSLRSPT